MSTKRKKCIQECIPISQPCGQEAENVFTYFSNPTNSIANGMVIIRNTGYPVSGCTMDVFITDSNVRTLYTINPGAAITVLVQNLRLIGIACTGSASICTGELILNLEFCVTTCVTRCQYRYN